MNANWGLQEWGVLKTTTGLDVAIEWFFVFFCFSLSLHFLLLHSFFFIVLHIQQKRYLQFFKKTRKNKFENKSKNALHTVSISWIKERRNKLSMTKKSCKACSIRSVQLNHFYIRHRVFYRVWLSSKAFNPKPFFNSHQKMIFQKFTYYISRSFAGMKLLAVTNCLPIQNL